MNILFVSSILRENDFEKISLLSKKSKPSIAGQRFETMIANGLKANGANIKVLSYAPLSPYPKTKKLFWNYKKVQKKNIEINYIPLVNLPILKQVCILIFSFLYILFWMFKNKGKKSCILLNLVYIPIAIPTIILSKIFRVQNSVLVPDVSTYRFSYVTSKSKIKKVISKVKKYSSEYFDHKFGSYIFLTKYMNDLMNNENKPYIVIEGMINREENNQISINKDHSNNKKYIMYAGTLRKKYGINKLIKAFSQIIDDDTELWIFGSGDQMEYIENITLKNTNIKYKGVRPFEEIFKYEQSAYLLINPRPSEEEFTKYSFPSKTLEYMSSGTPLLTTDLPGIPNEYKQFIYVFNDETIEGMKCKINELLNMDKINLNKIGYDAKKFVEENKNHIYQTKKILSFLNKITK